MKTLIGYFASAELAYEAGKKEGFAFKIEKFQIISEDTIKMKQWSVVSPILVKDEDKQIEELDVPGSPVAALEYDADGKLIDYWSYEVSKEDNMEKNLVLDVHENPSSIKDWFLFAIQHVLAMLVACITVPLITGLPIGPTLIAAGIGTLIYVITTKGAVK